MKTAPNPNAPAGNGGAQPPRLGYVILHVPDVLAAVAFYEAAFGLARRFVHPSGYAEMETGATALAFASHALAEANGLPPTSHGQPSGAEVALVMADVAGAFQRAVQAGAAPAVAPGERPWGQVVGYVRDLNGFLVELCSPMDGSSGVAQDPASLRALLAAAAPDLDLTFRPMFGGIMGYAAGKPFASLSDAGLALKLAGADHAALLALPGARPLQHEPDSPPSRSYVVLPRSVLDDPAALAAWARRSAGSAAARPARKRRRPPTAPA